jgi:hypothetical protein
LLLRFISGSTFCFFHSLKKWDFKKKSIFLGK